MVAIYMGNVTDCDISSASPDLWGSWSDDSTGTHIDSGYASYGCCDYGHQVVVSSEDELGQLKKACSQMSEDLVRHIAELC